MRKNDTQLIGWPYMRRQKQTFQNAWLLPVVVITLHVGGLHAVGLGGVHEHG